MVGWGPSASGAPEGTLTFPSGVGMGGGAACGRRVVLERRPADHSLLSHAEATPRRPAAHSRIHDRPLSRLRRSRQWAERGGVVVADGALAPHASLNAAIGVSRNTSRPVSIPMLTAMPII